MNASVRAEVRKAMPRMAFEPSMPVDLRRDGWPEAMALPDSADAVAEVLGLAAERGWSVLPVGAGTRIPHLEKPPTLVLSTRLLRSIERYEPADLTMTVGAGATMREIDEATRPNGQWVPLDPAGFYDGTIGAMVATGRAGPLGAGFGRPRDHLLGARMATGDGQMLSLGGVVVKNVAGFDLLKLLCGSRGSLGILTSLSVRLFPSPVADRSWVRSFGSMEESIEAARRIAVAPVELASLEWEDVGAGSADRFQVRARVLGRTESTERLLREVRELGGGGRLPPHDEAAELRRTASREECAAPISLRVSALPSRWPEIASALSHVSVAMSEEVDMQARTHVRSGVTRISLTPRSLDDSRGWVEPVRSFRDSCIEFGASIRVDRAPGAIGASVCTSEPTGRVAEILEGIRAAFDPSGVFPGELRPW